MQDKQKESYTTTINYYQQLDNMAHRWTNTSI